MSVVISVEDVSKAYRLGLINARTLSNEIRVALARMRGKPNPLLKVDQEHLANREGEMIWALRDVSFQVEQGEVLGIIGRNGSGKSTLLKILSRVTAPTNGQVRIKGRIASLLEVGTGFHPDLTGRENVYLNGAILGMTREEVSRKFEEIVDFSGIERFIDTPVKRYSSGMYVRLAFAVAAHLEPEILLLDEVLAVGDAEFQKKCLGKMSEVARQGRTVLFVSHNLIAVKNLCQKGVLLDYGVVDRIGPIEQVVSHYISRNAQLRGSLEWPDVTTAPGDASGRITAIRLLDNQGQTTTQAALTEPVVIEVAYQTLVPGATFNVALAVYNAEDSVVFVSPSFNKNDLGGKPHPLGRFVSRATIPGGLLNQGHYSVTVMLVLNKVHAVANLPKALTLEVIDNGENREEYYGTWSGVVRPQIPWTTQIVEG